MRLFAQIGWYFRREWRRYLGAVVLLIVIAILQLLPPKLVGIIVDGVTEKQMSTGVLMAWLGLMIGTAIVVYLLRYVWRVLLFGASYQLAVELRENFYRQLSRQNPAFYLRHRTGDLMARATNDVDRVVFAAGEGVLTLVDSLVMGLVVLVVMSTQISWQLTVLALIPMPLMAIAIKYYGDQLHQRFKSAQAAFSSLNDQAQESMTSIRERQRDAGGGGARRGDGQRPAAAEIPAAAATGYRPLPATGGGPLFTTLAAFTLPHLFPRRMRFSLQPAGYDYPAFFLPNAWRYKSASCARYGCRSPMLLLTHSGL